MSKFDNMTLDDCAKYVDEVLSKPKTIVMPTVTIHGKPADFEIFGYSFNTEGSFKGHIELTKQNYSIFLQNWNNKKEGHRFIEFKRSGNIEVRLVASGINGINSCLPFGEHEPHYFIFFLFSDIVIDGIRMSKALS